MQENKEKAQLLLEHNNDLSHRWFCYHEGYIWLYMAMGRIHSFKWINSSRLHKNCPNTVRKQNAKSVIGSISKMNHLSDVFVVWEIYMWPNMCFWGIFPKMTENPVEKRITAKLTRNKLQSFFSGWTEKWSIYKVFPLSRMVKTDWFLFWFFFTLK